MIALVRGGNRSRSKALPRRRFVVVVVVLDLAFSFSSLVIARAAVFDDDSRDFRA